MPGRRLFGGHDLQGNEFAGTPIPHLCRYLYLSVFWRSLLVETYSSSRDRDLGEYVCIYQAVNSTLLQGGGSKMLQTWIHGSRQNGHVECDLVCTAIRVKEPDGSIRHHTQFPKLTM